MTNKQAATSIIKRLKKAGYEALFAGGCVRDMIIGRRPKDYDVATNARPDQVSVLFKRKLKIGAKFGVVMVLIGDQQVEVATFRTESGYDDGRHPTQVKFATAQEDASRRDFTINGMFYDSMNDTIIDYVNGQKDIQLKVIRTIGNANERFDEDYLRMLRAIRFSTELDYDIEKMTWQAIKSNAEKITGISAERITLELESILTHPNRQKGVQLLVASGLFEQIFPDISLDHIDYGVEVLGNLKKGISFSLGLACLFAGYEASIVIKECEFLRLSRLQQKDLKFLLDHRDCLLDQQLGLAELKVLLSGPYFWDLLDFQKAILKAEGKSTRPLSVIKKKAKELAGKELQPAPLLNGHQIIALGVRPGPPVGHVQKEMYMAQLAEKLQTVEDAEKWIKKWLKKHKDL